MLLRDGSDQTRRVEVQAGKRISVHARRTWPVRDRRSGHRCPRARCGSARPHHRNRQFPPCGTGTRSSAAPDSRNRPQLAPIPNKVSASTMRRVACGENSGSKTIPNKLQAPVKSRFHRSCPGAPGSAGNSTWRISGRASSHSATRSAEADCCANRTPIVRTPRRHNQQSSGLAYCPSASEGGAHPLPILVVGHGDGAEQHVRVPDRIFRQRLDRHVDARNGTAGSGGCPTYCPSTPWRRAAAPPRPAPGRPASRTCGCPGSRDTARWYSGA